MDRTRAAADTARTDLDSPAPAGMAPDAAPARPGVAAAAPAAAPAVAPPPARAPAWQAAAFDAGLSIGQPINRVDGWAKVSGQARYAGEFFSPDLAYGVVVSGAIAKGRITRIDTAEALAVPGVVQVFTHENRPRTAWFDRNWQDDDAPPGSPFRPLYDDRIVYSGQPVALVVADTFEAARWAAALVRVEYEAEPHQVDLIRAQDDAFAPRRAKSGFEPPKSRGDAAAAYDRAPIRHEAHYRHGFEHHNPMEMHASTVVWEGDGRLTVYDKTQGAQNSQAYVCGVFGLSTDDVRVLSPYVGGAFGSGLRPQYQLFLAVMAATVLERSVRVTLTRQQMFSFGYRPDTLQSIKLGAEADGQLVAIVNDAVGVTSRFENYTEVVVNWGALAYRCDNAELSYRIAPVDLYTPLDMRAPGAATGLNVFEVALDELAYRAVLDPLELRLKNYSEVNEMTGKPYTSKALRACYEQGAARFGWSRRDHRPCSMREGRELIGWGMATGVWDAMMSKTTARATLTADGFLEVATATADIGTGTYTVMTQVAAETMGLPADRVRARLGDSSLPPSPIEGGSWGAASSGSAVKKACEALREALWKHARKIDGSPFADASLQEVAFAGGRLVLASDPLRSLGYGEVLRAAGLDRIEAEETALPAPVSQMRYARNSHSAVFAEVRVDEELGAVRVTRIVNAVAAGRIINPKTARSQVVGGVVFGIGMALHEETMADRHLGRFMNHNLAEYHLPVNADVHAIEVIFVDEPDAEVNALGVKGVGEIGIVGTAAAIANAIFHATGRRVREYPITIDKLL